MKTAILLGAGLGLALALPGAASAHTTNGQGMSYGQGYQHGQEQGMFQQGGQHSASAPATARRLHEELQRAGFTNIHIRPHSFLVRAQDPDGNPVRIVVSPTTVAMATLEQSGGQQGEQGMQNQGMQNGGMQNQGMRNEGMQGSNMGGWQR